jgi:ABC-type lipoprotein export system ATPase subunit
MNAILRLENVGKADANGRSLVRSATFSIEEGQWVSIHGPAGSGKTALLRLVAGMDTPDSGRVFVRGQAVHGMDADASTSFRSSTFGICLREPALLPFLPIWENVSLTLAIQGSRMARRKQLATDALCELGIAYAAHALPTALSVYERSLTSLARALAASPPILLLDEVAADLPERDTARLMESMRRIAEQRSLTVISCTSGQGEFPGANRRFTMEHGRITEVP